MHTQRKNGRIVPWNEYGRHIHIKCQHNVDFTTKNIDYIGARSIFAKDSFGIGCTSEERCRYEVVVPENWLDSIVPIGICKCDKCGDEICEEGRLSNPNVCGYCWEYS